MTTISDEVAGAAAAPLNEDRLACLALALTPGLGPRRIYEAVQSLGGAARIFAMSLTELESLRFPAQTVQWIFDGKARQIAEEEWARVCEKGGTLVSLNSPEYPERLKEIYDPPPVLWLHGNASLLMRPLLAVVGTRHRHLRAQGRSGGAHAHRGGVGHGDRRDVSRRRTRSWRRRFWPPAAQL